ncbi:uncharacterized protein [Haliotis asinina]|uniref:uncharacterized protein n=1 Tax=Haliotis asinina TaxID=109174 RepID=UPI00353272A3
MAILIGKMNASSMGVEYAPLHFKHLEIAKNVALKQAKGNYDGPLTLDKQCVSDLHWWIDNVDKYPVFLERAQPTIVVKSDASKSVCGETSAGGQWNSAESNMHINCLELEAAGRVLKSLCAQLRNMHIRLLLDNTTAVAYINHMGGTKLDCNNITREIWLWCIERKLWISAAHVPGVCNMEADWYSRNNSDDKEWQIDVCVFNKLTSLFGTPDIDLFASKSNHQLQRYVSWYPDPSASAIDAFSLYWGDLYSYIFCPFSIIGVVLKKIQEEQADALMIVPLWTTQPWFTKLLQLLTDCPRLLPKSPQLLKLTYRKDVLHPLHKKLQLAAVKLSGKLSSVKVFQSQLRTSYCSHGEIRPTNSMGVISKNGCNFAMNKMLIPFHHLSNNV